MPKTTATSVTGNITKQGATKNGKLQTFTIALYNGKDNEPFFVRVKAFPQTQVDGRLEPRNRVEVVGNLRLDRWKNKDDQEVETLTIYADKVTDSPWEGTPAEAHDSVPF